MQTEPQDVSYIKSLFKSGDSRDEFQQKIADIFPAIVYVYDTEEKKIQFINKQHATLLGYSYEEAEQWDNDFMKFVFKDDISLVQKELEKCSFLHGNNTHSYKSRFNHKIGTWRYFRTQGTILHRNDSGNPAKVLFVAQDITHELQIEEEVKVSKDLLNETEKLLHFGTWTWDIPNNKVEWSDGLCTLLGYTENDLTSKFSKDSFIQHVAEFDAKDLDSAIENALSNKSEFESTFTVITKDKKAKIVSARGRVLSTPGGGVIKLIVVTHDITEQMLLQREQQELKDNLAEYKELMIEKERILDFGSFEMDLSTKELHWSDGMYLLYGYDPTSDKEKIKLDEDFYKIHLAESEILAAREKLNIALQTKDNYTLETSIRTKKGIVKRLETYGKIESLIKGQPRKIVGITRDITRLKDYEKNLQHKIEELDRSNKELEEFAYIASHDLQEPLRKITAFGERLQEKAFNEIGEEGQLYLKRILAATQNMRLLIDNLLEFSRTTRHNHTLEKIDLNVIIKEVLTDLELKIEETNTIIHCSLLPSVSIYHSQMKQLFTNLLSNAIKFRKPSEQPIIKITSEVLSDKEKNDHFLTEDKQYYKIKVTDLGIGFEQEYAFKIFQIFQRLHGKSEYPGSGIGLAICKKIVDNHNGIIYAESAPGKGATFSILLPEKQ